MSQGNAKGITNEGYSPTVPSNWPVVPNTPGQALDEIAASVPLNYPIPNPPAYPQDQSPLAIHLNQIFQQACDFYFDSVDGNVWVTDNASAHLVVLNAITLVTIATIDLSSYLDTTTKIVANSTYVFVNHTTGILNGNYILVINKTTKTLVGILDAVGAASDLAVDGTGQVWVVDTGNQIVRLFTTSDITAAISGFPTPQSGSGGTFLGSNQPNSICYDSVDNQIWVGTLGHTTNEQLYQLDISGTILNTYDATGLTAFGWFNRLTYYNGFVWCATNSNSILQVNPATFTTGSGADGGAVVELDIVGPNATKTINIDPYTTTILVGSGNGIISRVNAVASPTLADNIVIAPNGAVNGIGTSNSRLFISNSANGVLIYSNTVSSEIKQGFYSGPVQGLQWSSAPILFDGGSPTNNLTTNRSANQSKIDSTKQGIVNFGSDTTNVQPPSSGNFATISGGDQSTNNGDYGTIGGGFQNFVNAQYSTVGGGNTNNVFNQYGTVSGGGSNQITADYGTISGGYNHTVAAEFGSIGGGQQNTVTVSSIWGTVSGGDVNVANASYATVGGGYSNNCGGFAGVVAGGYQNSASGSYTPIVIGGQSCASNGNHSISGGYYSIANVDDAIALGYNNTASGISSISLGYSTLASRFGQLSLSSAGGNIIGAPVAGTSSGDAQNGNVVFGTKQPTPGTSFVLTDASATPSEFHLLNDVTGYNQYYMMTITMIMYANNATVGPVTAEYKVMAHVAGGIAIIDHQAELLVQIGFPNDPNTTGWLTSITVDGTTDILHINVDPNGDSTNTINASADIKWIEVSGFAQ